LILTDEELQNLTLIEIEKHLQSNGKSLKDFKCMPYPNGFVADFFENRLIHDERSYDPIVQQQIFDQLFSSLTG